MCMSRDLPCNGGIKYVIKICYMVSNMFYGFAAICMQYGDKRLDYDNSSKTLRWWKKSTFRQEYYFKSSLVRLIEKS